MPTACVPPPLVPEQMRVLSCDPVLFGLERAELQPACFNYEAGADIAGAQAQPDPTRCAPRAFLETGGYIQQKK